MPTRPVRAVTRNQRIHTVPASATVRTAAHVMKEHRIGALMVVEGERLIGIFTERDALFRVLAGGLDPDRTRVGEVMTAEPTTVSPDQSVMHALHLMHEGGFRHLPVAERGMPAGMVSIRDALGVELSRFEREVHDREAIAEILG
ncbi:CBS domain-containing protein [Azospirillum agricola]|uniref:CBS domain-containing protein n=1 Tax=Azospirillum agricola TaxID=1720247 RepID=UPI000A0F3749|nr:CBS domain-containing protein [Azospirillum agricola]SMH57974.1 CBS domain-containing protein [Azospirillum lipoferum]